MQRTIWGHSPARWHAMFASAAQAKRRHRRTHINALVDCYVEELKAGDAVSDDMIAVSRELMQIVARAEQIDLLSRVLLRVDRRRRDDALELITALLPYAKGRRNAPATEIPGVSLFDAIARRCDAAGRRPPRRRHHRATG